MRPHRPPCPHHVACHGCQDKNATATGGSDDGAAVAPTYSSAHIFVMKHPQDISVFFDP